MDVIFLICIKMLFFRKWKYFLVSTQGLFINNIAKEIKTGKFDDKENINRLIDLIGEPIIQKSFKKIN